MAEAVSFLKMGSHRRVVDSTLTTGVLPRSHLSPGTRFPCGAGSWRRSDHRSIGNGIVHTRSDVGACPDCLARRAHISDTFAKYSADRPRPCGLDRARLCIRASAAVGKRPTTQMCIGRADEPAPWLLEFRLDLPPQTASAPHSGPRVPY